MATKIKSATDGISSRTQAASGFAAGELLEPSAIALNLIE
jgi:hypothetical protein